MSEILTEKSYKSYDYISRYENVPYYYNNLDKKYYSNISKKKILIILIKKLFKKLN